jgi:hypothetical protein
MSVLTKQLSITAQRTLIAPTKPEAFSAIAPVVSRVMVITVLVHTTPLYSTPHHHAPHRLTHTDTVMFTIPHSTPYTYICAQYLVISLIFEIDINECRNTTFNNCSGNAICENVNGGYHCNCMSGWMLTPQGFNCTGKKCFISFPCFIIYLFFGFVFFFYLNFCIIYRKLDLDECSDSKLNNCTTGSTCKNTPGSYYCIST